MYVNKIDTLFDEILEDLNNHINNKNFINNKKNFLENQKEINIFLVSYFKTLDLNIISEEIKILKDKNYVINKLNIYVCYFLFLYLGLNSINAENEFIYNLIEFSKNQINFEYKLENFFNSETNANIINYFKIINKILIILSLDEDKISEYLKKPENVETLNILNEIGKDIIDIKFRIENKDEQINNIIKTILFIDFYRKKERKILSDMIENSEDDEYIYINIIIPNKKHIDYNMVENILSAREIDIGLVDEFWKLIKNSEEVNSIQISNENKIIELIQCGMFIPIVEDFLLYHKDIESYEIETDKSIRKKKEITKIKYIVNKLELTADYYSAKVLNNSERKQLADLNFNLQLIDRRAVIINNNEDIDIINKLLNQNIKDNEYFSEFSNFKVYAYNNFKDFSRDGFNINLNKTINVMRSVTVENTIFKQKNKNILQMRSGSKDLSINIVGLMIPSNINSVFCLQNIELLDISKLSNTNNGYRLFVKYLENIMVKNKKHGSSIYWLFNLQNDKVIINNYEQENSLTQQEQMKMIMFKLYNEIIDLIYKNIYTSITPIMDIKKSFNYFKQYEDNPLKLSVESDNYYKLEQYILFDNSIKTDGRYDINEDIFHGISDNIIKLKNIPPPLEYPIKQIKINMNIKKITDRINSDKVIGICQHNITWDYIRSIRKISPSKYSDLLFQFGEQYIIETEMNEYICKSCSGMLDIKKYIYESYYDTSTQKFKTFSSHMEVPLEEIKEYEKYKGTITSLDKLIEKIAIISKVPYFIGGQTIKWRRKIIIKDTIDIILINTSLLGKIQKSKKDQINKYGINKNLSNIFSFELDNNIFLFTSKDKDYLRLIKYNNIIAYTVILIILELNESNAIFMDGETKGLCNYSVFEKYGNNLFDGLKIIINRDSDITNIIKYPVLCYMIYIISCMITKYGMWYYEYPEDVDKKKSSVIVQKTIINTVIDILNNIIENSISKNSSRIYDIISTKFFYSLPTIYSKVEMLDRFKINEQFRKYIQSNLIKVEPILITKFTYSSEPSNYNTCIFSKQLLNLNFFDKISFNNVNNITNCLSGEFHKWVYKNELYQCGICSIDIKTNIYNPKISAEIVLNYKYIKLRNLVEKYCLQCELHNFNTSSNNVCSKCNKNKNYEYSKNELNDFEKYFNTINKIKIINYNNKKETKINTVIENIINQYNSIVDNEPYKFIDNFLDTINAVIGVEVGSNANFKENIYILDHDYFGIQLKEPIQLSDKDNKIFIKYNAFFKKTVITYTSNVAGKVDVYYDLITHILLGYKETSKDYVILKDQYKKIKIKYSIYEKIKILGYESKTINIIEKIQDYSVKYNAKKVIYIKNVDKDLMINIMKDIIRIRIKNLKKIIYELQRYLYRIKNNYKVKIRVDKETEYEDPIIEIVEKYSNKIKNMEIYDINKENKIFGNWKIINYYFYLLNKIEIDFEITDTIDASLINSLDKHGNLILYYIVSEFTKLINYNSDKFIRTNIIYFLLDFINIAFDMFNTEAIMENFEMKMFVMANKYSEFLLGRLDYEQTTYGIYEELLDDKEQTPEEQDIIADNIEEAQALDIDTAFNYQQNYDMLSDRELQVETYNYNIDYVSNF
jgi:hypothetical protein